MIETFQELGLPQYLLNAIKELGFERPTPVQERIIPTLLENKETNIVCLAQTGTGKTAAFGLPTLAALDTNNTNIQALVLSPTRELCKQITGDLKNYAKYKNGFAIVDVYGGAGIEMQIKALQRNPQIVVATPGRLIDMLERKALTLEHINTLILDEADEMLNMGFKDDLDAILAQTPQQKQTLLFSATLPVEVEKIAKTYMNNPQIVTVGERNSGAQNVEHHYYVVHEKDRYPALKRIVDYCPNMYGIIFCRTRRECGEVASALIKDGYNAEALHGDLSQQQRDLVMKRFKSKTVPLLVATDVAARGIDVNNLTHVINYNLPDEIEQYTHRSGRTGRADKSGISLVLINIKEQHKIRRIEKMIQKTFTKSKVPTGSEVCSKQMLSLIEHISNVEVKEQMEEYIPLMVEKWKNINAEDIILKLMSLEFNRFLDYYKNAPDLNLPDNKEKKRDRGKDREPQGRKDNKRGGREEGSPKSGAKEGAKEAKKGRGNGNSTEEKKPNSDDYLKTEKGFTWITFSLGEKHRITNRHIIRMLTSAGVGRKGIGRIDIKRDHTNIQLASSAAEKVVAATNGTMYKGKALYSSILKK